MVMKVFEVKNCQIDFVQEHGRTLQRRDLPAGGEPPHVHRVGGRNRQVLGHRIRGQHQAKAFHNRRI